MKKNMEILIFVAVVFGLNGQVFGWCGKTHEAITKKAISSNNQSVLDGYLKDELDIEQGLSAILSLDQSTIPDPNDRIPSDQLEDRISSILPPNPSVLDLLKFGSHLEDVPNPRAKHHFHDPYRNTGLENKTEHPALAIAFNTATYVWYWGDNKFDLTGALCLKRALGTEDPKWEQEYENYFAWPDARDYLYRALTQESEAAREHYLALTFLSLGHVLHLLEDMGVPAHARNDFIEAHFRGLYPGGIGNPLESHAEKEIINNDSNIPSDWLNSWTANAKVFSKLADYWDTEDYTGVYDTNEPNESWGLAESTNYQFLSYSTIFKENDGETKYYFPQPDVNNVTGYVRPGVYYWNSVPVNYRYISGYEITHLARNKFIEMYAVPIIPYPVATVAYHTTFDEAVYEDYAKVTVPRTIDYATGLANYFFRGRLSAEPNCIDCNEIELAITNDSNNSGVEQTLKGGSFELYWDDGDGNRTEVSDFAVDGWGSGSTLTYGDSVTGTFTVPEGEEVENYILLYKGNICEDPNHLDTDDSEAIAVCLPDIWECGDDCGYCISGKTPKYIDVTFSNIATTVGQCCNYSGLGSSKYSFLKDLTGTWRFKQAGACAWQYSAPERVATYKSFVGSNCEGFSGTADSNAFYMRITRTGDSSYHFQIEMWHVTYDEWATVIRADSSAGTWSNCMTLINGEVNEICGDVGYALGWTHADISIEELW